MNKKLLLIYLLSSFCIQVYSQDIEPMHNDKGQFGYGVKSTKTFTIKPQWDEARHFNDEGVAIVRKGTSLGLIDKTGKPIGVRMGYSIIEPYDGTNYWIVALGGKRVDDVSKIKNRKGISPIGFKGSTSYPIKGAKWGLLRKDGKPQTEIKYEEISNIMAGNIIVVQLKNKFGYINSDGVEKIAPQFGLITPFNNQGIAGAQIKKSGYWVLLNSNGSVIIDGNQRVNGYLLFFDINSYLNNNLLTKLREDIKRIVPLMSDVSGWINSAHPYVVAVQHKKKVIDTAIYDIYGKCLVSFGNGISDCYAPSENMMLCNKDGQKGFFDIETRTFVPVVNRVYFPFKDGYSLSCKSENELYSDYYLVSKTGVRKTEIFDNVYMANNRYIVKKGVKYGIISSIGEYIIPLEYDEVTFGGDNFFIVKDKNGKFGFCDVDGKMVISSIYDKCSPFINGYAVVSKKNDSSSDTLQGIIDCNSKVILPIAYKKAVCNVDKDGNVNVWVSNSNLFSKYDVNTNKLCPTEYIDMQNLPIGIQTKDVDGWYGLLLNSTEVIPCVVKDCSTLIKLYDYMSKNNISRLSRLEAHRISANLNPQRNNYKLKDVVDENIWDF